MKRFSFFDRQNTIDEFKSTVFDVLIVGGGITGAGIALERFGRVWEGLGGSGTCAD